METIYYDILFSFLLAVLAITCLININAIDKRIDKRIDERIAEEKRQNKRMDLLEKHEQIRQSELRRDNAYIDAKDLFEKW